MAPTRTRTVATHATESARQLPLLGEAPQEQVAERRPRQSVVVGNQNAVPKSGVYFLRSADRKRVKIGKSKNVAERIRSIANMNSRELTLVAAIPGGYSLTENALHRMFASSRQHGEWFAMDASIRSLIEKVQANSLPFEIRNALAADKNTQAESRPVVDDSDDEPVTRARLPRAAKVRYLKSDREMLDLWKSEGAPTLEDVEVVSWSEFCAENFLSDEVPPPRLPGAWLERDSMRVYSGGHVGPRYTAVGLLHDSNEQRLRSFIRMAYNDFDAKRLRFRGVYGTYREPMEILGWPSRHIEGNTKYCLPYSDVYACSRLRAEGSRCKCDNWPWDDSAPDQVEELRRVAHCAEVWYREWRLVSFDVHPLRCECGRSECVQHEDYPARSTWY